MSTDAPETDPHLDANLDASPDDLDQRIRDLVRSVGPNDNDDLVRELISTALMMKAEKINRLDLKIATKAVTEMHDAWRVFEPYNDRPKVTIFGSARTKPDHPDYRHAHDVAAKMAERGWMILTGAGPGIMTAGIEGAGRENSFGINIELPFEPAPSPAIQGDPKLINFRYFFTRKLTFIKESDAVIVSPGGVGTMDETFELLTLIQTGRSYPVPIVLLESPGETYWESWLDFIREAMLGNGMLNEHDFSFFLRTDSVDEAVEEICSFYGTYHSIRFVGTRLIIRTNREISDSELSQINADFADIVAEGAIERMETSRYERRDNDVPDLPRIGFRFDLRSFGRLRQLINALNAGGPTPEKPMTGLPHSVNPGLGTDESTDPLE